MNNMVLYHCITTYHLLEFMVHSMLYHGNAECVLIVPEFLAARTPDIMKLTDRKVFDDVKTMRYRAIPHNDWYLKKTEDYWNLLGIELENFDEINVAGAQYYFSALLIEKEIKFNFWEEASGVLTQHESVEKIVKGISGHQHEITQKNHMYDGDNPFVNKIFCNFKGQKKGFQPDSRMVDFDLVSEINKLSKEQLQMILRFFGTPENLAFKQDGAMILTQHFANLGMMSFDEQIEIYQSTADYYLENKPLYFKVHPDDLIYYSQLFPQSVVMKEKFPSELIPFISESRPNMIAAVSSTGIRNIASEYQEILNFNIEYEKSFRDNNRYYLILKILEAYEGLVNHVIRVYIQNVNRCQFINMVKYSDVDIQIQLVDSVSEAEFIVIGRENAYEMKLDSHIPVLMFDLTSFAGGNWKVNRSNIIAKRVVKARLKDEIYTNLDDEYIYLWTTDKDIRRCVKEMNYEKELYYSGIKTTVSDTTDSEMKIAVLEGILEATEKRLQYYINRENQLLEELASMGGK